MWELHLELKHPGRNRGLGTGAPWLWGFRSGWLLPVTCVRTLPGGFSPGRRADVPWCPSQLQCPRPAGTDACSHQSCRCCSLTAWCLGFFSWPVSVILDDLNTAFSDTKQLNLQPRYILFILLGTAVWYVCSGALN